LFWICCTTCSCLHGCAAAGKISTDTSRRAVRLLFAPNIIHGKLEVLSGMETPAMRRLQLGSCEASLFYSTATAAAVYGADGEKSKRRQ